MVVRRGRTWIYFRLPDGTTGFRLWGTPSAADIEEVLTMVETSMREPPHASIVDATYVDGYAPDAFTALSRFVRTRADALRSAVTRLAVVRGQTPIGAMAAGFFDVETAPYPTQTHTTLDEALQWLDVPDHARVARDLDAAMDGAVHSSSIVHAARNWIERELESPRAKACARALGLSERSLQRMLEAKGTSFRDLVADARVERAKRMLLETDHAISRIARAAGFNAVAAFSTAFRRRTGMSPREFRQSGSQGPSPT